MDSTSFANIPEVHHEEFEPLFVELETYIKTYFDAEVWEHVYTCLQIAIASKKQFYPDSWESQAVAHLKIGLILVKELGLGRSALIPSLLYDAAHHNCISDEEILSTYGEKVSQIIVGINKSLGFFNNLVTLEDDNFKDFLLTLSTEDNVILILIATRLYEIRNLQSVDRDRQLQLATECTHIHTPLAHMFGLYAVKTEFEDMTLRYIHPEIYFEIAKKLSENKRERDAYIKKFTEPIEKRLTELGLKFKIKGRTKSIHSIYNKVYIQGTPFEDVYDLYAIRVILNSAPEVEKTECWQVYSAVTELYKPNPKRLRDWLSTPKSNGYQSLHTTVMGMEGKWVEVQIRTQRMDVMAEKGHASHWMYKGVKTYSEYTEQRIREFRESLEGDLNKGHEVMSHVKSNSQDKEIYVFTPKGDILKYPKGATILDFAFDIHTQVGSRCTGAIVNGRNVPFKYKLSNGDKVLLNTSSSQTPKSEWLNLVITSKARNKIKQALRDAMHKDAEVGKEILKRRFKNWKIEFNEMALGKYIKKWGKKSVSEFYVAIRQGLIDPVDVRHVMHPQIAEVDSIKENREIGNYVPPKKDESGGDVLTIDNNLTNVMFKLAKCCNPIFGDLIFGFVTAGEGIKIHKESCPNASQMKQRFPYRIVRTEWSGISGDKYIVRLRITGNNDISIISNISSVLTKEFKVAIIAMSIDTSDGIFSGMFTISVEDTQKLERVIHRITRIKGISHVDRINN